MASVSPISLCARLQGGTNRSALFLHFLCSLLSFGYLAAAPGARAESFSDDFESPSVASFWHVANQSGGVQLATAHAHSGIQSIALSANHGQDGGGALWHPFDTASRGYASVWIYDTAPGQQTRYCHLTLYNTTVPYGDPGSYVWAGFEDWTPSYYQVIDPHTAQSVSTGIVRSEGWHHFEITVGSTSVEYRIDDQHVYLFTGHFIFDQISLEVYGPGWRPSATFYFDDFSVRTESNGSVAAWGMNDQGQYDVPAPNSGFVTISAGIAHCLGLKVNRSIVAWGRNVEGQCNVPTPNADFVEVAAGGYHNLGLRSDGTIIAWGLNGDGQCNVPAPNADFVAVAAGEYHSLGLKTDGSVVAWGRNNWHQIEVP